jgi:hypothetical protein
MLARLLATENISVVHQNIPTAFFDLRTRSLHLPMWSNASGSLYDMLVGHEVAHALFTPADGWRTAIDTISAATGCERDTAKQYLNIVEDARIERMIQTKFRGLKADFINAYKTLMEREFFGDISNIQAKFADFNHQKTTAFEDSGFVSFDFLNGGMGCVNYSTAVWDKNLESSLTIVGSKGSVKVGGQYMDQIEVCNIKDYVMPKLEDTNPANDYGAYKGSANNHHSVIENVVDTLKGKNKISTNALEGLKVVDIIERIYSLRQPAVIKNLNSK